ncbi:cytochrome b5, partial [Amborella trichopoda]|uniref:cytochrome b5 n=1 Tax=Amborella trichopoda TaxID=13333 RepID=UPI0009BF454A
TTSSKFYVSLHNNNKDCWVIIDNKVYDVTSYLDDHPGGDDVLLAVTGKDAKEEFEDAGHSADARKLMDEYFIGEVDLSETLADLNPTVKLEPSNLAQEFMNKASQYWFLPVVVAGVAVTVGLLHLRKKS